MYSITQIYRHGVYEKAPFTKYQQDDQGGHRVLKAQSALLGSQKEGGLVWGRGFALANAKIRQVQAVPYSQAHPLGYPRCYCHLRWYFYPRNRELQLNCSTLSLACCTPFWAPKTLKSYPHKLLVGLSQHVPAGPFGSNSNSSSNTYKLVQTRLSDQTK